MAEVLDKLAELKAQVREESEKLTGYKLLMKEVAIVDEFGKVIFSASDIEVPLKRGKSVSLGKKVEIEEVVKEEELNLIDLKSKFLKEVEEKKEEKEKEKEEEKKKKGIRLAFLKREEDKRTLEDCALANIEEIEKKIHDNRRKVILLAHTLKDYLEVKMGIREELTYSKLIEKLKESDVISDELKEKLADFFKKLILFEYANIGEIEAPYVKALAQQVIGKRD